MTKREARARKAAWQLALSEGRVVRSPDGMSLTSFPTRQEALQQIEHIRLCGFGEAEIVQVQS